MNLDHAIRRTAPAALTFAAAAAVLCSTPSAERGGAGRAALAYAQDGEGKTKEQGKEYWRGQSNDIMQRIRERDAQLHNELIAEVNASFLYKPPENANAARKAQESYAKGSPEWLMNQGWVHYHTYNTLEQAMAVWQKVVAMPITDPKAREIAVGKSYYGMGDAVFRRWGAWEGSPGSLDDLAAAAVLLGKSRACGYRGGDGTLETSAYASQVEAMHRVLSGMSCSTINGHDGSPFLRLYRSRGTMPPGAAIVQANSSFLKNYHRVVARTLPECGIPARRLQNLTYVVASAADYAVMKAHPIRDETWVTPDGHAMIITPNMIIESAVPRGTGKGGDPVVNRMHELGHLVEHRVNYKGFLGGPPFTEGFQEDILYMIDGGLRRNATSIADHLTYDQMVDYQAWMRQVGSTGHGNNAWYAQAGLFFVWVVSQSEGRAFLANHFSSLNQDSSSPYYIKPNGQTQRDIGLERLEQLYCTFINREASGFR